MTVDVRGRPQLGPRRAKPVCTQTASVVVGP